jgi:hypothetical protein
MVHKHHHKKHIAAAKTKGHAKIHQVRHTAVQ